MSEPKWIADLPTKALRVAARDVRGPLRFWLISSRKADERTRALIKAAIVATKEGHF